MNCNLHLRFYSTLLEHSRKVLSCLRTCILYPCVRNNPSVQFSTWLAFSWLSDFSSVSPHQTVALPHQPFSLTSLFILTSTPYQKLSFYLLTHLCIVFPHCNLSCARAGTLSELFIVVFVVPRIVLAKGRFSVPLYWLNKRHFDRSLST